MFDDNSSSSSSSDSDYEEERGRHKRRLLLVLWEMINNKLFRPRALNLEGRSRRQRGLPRESLLDPDKSPWYKLYYSGNDQALITATGFDHNAAFAALMVMFRPYYCRYTPWTGKHDGRTFKRLSKPVALNTGRNQIMPALDWLVWLHRYTLQRMVEIWAKNAIQSSVQE